jgi:hypothetical protein
VVEVVRLALQEAHGVVVRAPADGSTKLPFNEHEPAFLAWFYGKPPSGFCWEENPILGTIAVLHKSKAMKEITMCCLEPALSPEPSNLAINLKLQYTLCNKALKRIFTLVWYSLDHSYTGHREMIGPYDLLPITCTTASTLCQQLDLELLADKVQTLTLGDLEWANQQKCSDQLYPTYS